MLLDFLRFWTPAEKFRQLAALDEEAPSYSLGRHASLERVHYCVFIITLCLLLTFYGKYFEVLASLSSILAWLLGKPQDYFQQLMTQSNYLDLIRYGWWAAIHAISYVLIPSLFIKWVLKDSAFNYGWRWNATHKHWQGYVFLLAPILVMVYLASGRSDFSHHYPFYKLARRSQFDLLTWEACYLLQFICLEFFFRGFILQALRPALGAKAIWLMVPPYLMIHFSKPWLEATGAIFFGLFLGILAMRSRSIWGGFFVHCGVALSMDFAALHQQGPLPSNFWPG